MEEQLNTNEYRTGHTQPSEKHTGPVAALFICVIFLGGLLSVLGLLNIHLSDRDQPPVSFTQDHTAESGAEETAQSVATPLGFTCQNMAMTYQFVHHLPTGLFINHVKPGSPAAYLGIEAGDVLVSFDGTPVTHTDTLDQLLANCAADHRANLVIYSQDGHSAFIIALDRGA